MKRTYKSKLSMREKITKLTRVNDATGCWEWQGVTLKGYGQTHREGKTMYAHRAAYEEWGEPIPPGMELDHLCRNTKCVNPYHLEVVTRAENARRLGESITHCKRGHEFTPENTYRSPDRPNQKNCRTCRRDYARAAWRKKHWGEAPA